MSRCVLYAGLTLSTVVPHVAFLAETVVLSTRSAVHAADVTVLDCGREYKQYTCSHNPHTQKRTHIHPRTHTHTHTCNWVIFQ